MTLPVLLSVPHAGLLVPPEVESLCILTLQEIAEDGDGGAEEIYMPLKSEVKAFVTTRVARAIVDMNRAEDDFRKDGVIKTHTCWEKPVYRDMPSEEIIESLLETWHRPYHQSLSKFASQVKIGFDCHTMAAVAPPVGPDPGSRRPSLCLSNADETCPWPWIYSFAAILTKKFKFDVSINHPFKGGYIIRSHAKEIPWMQIEFSRAPFLSNEEKSRRLLAAMKEWCRQTLT